MSKSPSPPWRLTLRFCVLGIIAFVTTLVLALSWISFQGRREWAKTKADLLARGEKLSFAEFVPPPIPDEQNFFDDPIWKELTDVDETISENGLQEWKVRLPYGKRRIDAVDPPLTPELRAREAALLRDPWAADSFKYRGSQFIRTATSRLRESNDPAERRVLAQFILDVFALGEPVREHLEMLLDRPKAVFPIDYSSGLPTPSAYPSYFITLKQIYSDSANAYLVLGNSKQSAREIITLVRLADTLDSAPSFVSFQIRNSLLATALSTINLGITQHRWDEKELEEFAQRLDRADLPRRMALCLRTERAWTNQIMQAMARYDRQSRAILSEASLYSQTPLEIPLAIVPAIYPFFIASDQASYNRFCQTCIDALDRDGGFQLDSLPGKQQNGAFWTTTHFLTATSAQFILGPIPTTIYIQDAILQTRIACALERYWLQYGTYSKSLDDLVPAFIGAIPSPPIAGQNFHYRTDEAGNFKLWSPGWNRTDEDGVTSRSSIDRYKEADWVWNEQPGPKR